MKNIHIDVHVNPRKLIGFLEGLLNGNVPPEIGNMGKMLLATNFSLGKTASEFVLSSSPVPSREGFNSALGNLIMCSLNFCDEIRITAEGTKPIIPEKSVSVSSHQIPPVEESLARPVSDFVWPTKARVAMINLGVVTLRDLVRHTGDELMKTPGFGPATLAKVKRQMALFGLKLKDE